MQRPIEFEPYAAVFLSLFHGESGDRSVRILNHQNRPLRMLLLVPSADWILPSVRTVREGIEFELTVRLGPDAPLGRRQEFVIIQTDDSEFAQLRVNVNVLIKADLYANPERIDFGEVDREQLRLHPGAVDMLSNTFLVKKREGNFEIRSVTSDIPALRLVRDPEGASDVFQIDASLNPAELRPGSLAGTIRITTNDAAFPLIQVPVSGTVR